MSCIFCIVDTGAVETVYNFEVEEFHTYYVGQAGIWVHNSQECVKIGGEVGGAAEADSLFDAAQKPIKGGQLTEAGRATTKHPEYFGFDSNKELRSVYSKDPQLNDLANQALREILKNGVRTTGAGGRYPEGWITYTLPDGRAASWYLSGKFIGFRGVNK